MLLLMLSTVSHADGGCSVFMEMFKLLVRVCLKVELDRSYLPLETAVDQSISTDLFRSFQTYHLVWSDVELSWNSAGLFAFLESGFIFSPCKSEKKKPRRESRVKQNVKSANGRHIPAVHIH